MGGEACASSTEDRSAEQSRRTRTATSSGLTGRGALTLAPALVEPVTATSSGRGSTNRGRTLPRVKVTELREMRRLYEEEGRSLQQVADAVGRGIGTVYSHLKAAGVPMNPSHQPLRTHPNALPHSVVMRTVELYESGLTTQQVADVLGVVESTVRRRMNSAGVARRSHSEALRLSPVRVRIARAVEDEVVRLYDVELLSARAVAARTGVTTQTVARVLARRGVRVRTRSELARIQRARMRSERPVAPPELKRLAVPPPSKPALPAMPHRQYVPSAPLARAVAASAPRLGGEGSLMRDAGVAMRTLWAWRTGERPEATWETADRVMLALGLNWWEVFDPADPAARAAWGDDE